MYIQLKVFQQSYLLNIIFLLFQRWSIIISSSTTDNENIINIIKEQIVESFLCQMDNQFSRLFSHLSFILWYKDAYEIVVKTALIEKWKEARPWPNCWVQIAFCFSGLNTP